MATYLRTNKVDQENGLDRVTRGALRLDGNDHIHSLLRGLSLRLVSVQHGCVRVMRRAAEVGHRRLRRHACHRAERCIWVKVGRRTVLLGRTGANKSNAAPADRRQPRGSGRRCRRCRTERGQALH